MHVRAGAGGGGGEPADLAGRWEVPLSDGVHVVEFEHGTVTGRRLVRIDGEVLHCLCHA